MQTTLVQNIPLALVHSSADNRPIKHDAALKELAESIKGVGLIHPVVVRVLKFKNDEACEYEIIAGHRRVEAARLAGLETIDASIRPDIDEHESQRIRMIENLQRENLNPMEEAAGFDKLMADGYTIDQLATELSKSKPYVYQRLALLTLAKKIQDLLHKNAIPISHAILLTRLKTHKEQLEMVSSFHDSYDDSWVDFIEAKNLIERTHFLCLDEAPFDKQDVDLYPAAGSCAACPKRTANQADLFPELAGDDDQCTDADCFNKKKKLTVEKQLTAAATKGVKVLDKAAAAKVFSKSGTVPAAAGYVDPDAACKEDPSWRNWGHFLSGKSFQGEETLAIDPSGKLRKIYPLETAKAALLKTLAKEKKNPRSVDRAKEKSKQKREVESSKTEYAADCLLMAEIVKKSEQAFKDKNIGALMGFVATCLWNYDSYGDAVGDAVARRRGLKGRDNSERYPAELASDAERFGLLVELAASTDSDSDGYGINIHTAAKLLKIDAKPFLKKAAEKIKAEAAVSAKASEPKK